MLPDGRAVVKFVNWRVSKVDYTVATLYKDPLYKSIFCIRTRHLCTDRHHTKIEIKI
jgi:hypothetical protein